MGRDILENAKRFLQPAGLPGDAAPFLSFRPTSLAWLDGRVDLDACDGIGSDDARNPFVVDPDGVVWLVDHEKPERLTFVNSSVPSLAGCLLAYRRLVEETIRAHGEDAFLDGNVPEYALNSFARSLQMIDGAAGRAGCFWAAEVSKSVRGDTT